MSRGICRDCDVFVGISGSGLKTGRLAQKRGGKYICDRGSSHIRWVDRMLTEEFARWGQEFEGVYPKHITREEAGVRPGGRDHRAL